MNVRLHIDRLVVDERLLGGRAPRVFERELVAAVARLAGAGELDATRLRAGARGRVRAPGGRQPSTGDPVEHLARAIVQGVRDG